MKLSRSFKWLWVGQFISLLGTHMSGFALGIYIYQETQSVFIYSLFPLLSIFPEIVFAPVLGVFIDRWNRKKAMILGHAGAGLCSLMIIFLFFQDAFDVILILPLVALSSLFNAFVFPAFTAATTQLVHSKALLKASGWVQLGFSLVIIASPALAGVCLKVWGILGIFAIDVVTFLAAILILSRIPIQSLDKQPLGEEKTISWWDELLVGFKYVRNNPFLLGTLVILSAIQFNIGMINVLIVPLVLNLGDSSSLGLIMLFSGVGLLLGSSLLMTLSRNHSAIHLMLCSSALQGFVFLGAYFIPLSIWIIGVSALLVTLCMGLVGGLNQALWQQMIPEHLQGRVFSIRTLAVGGGIMLGILLAGPVSEKIFFPLLNGERWIEGLISVLGGGTLLVVMVFTFFFKGGLSEKATQ